MWRTVKITDLADPVLRAAMPASAENVMVKVQETDTFRTALNRLSKNGILKIRPKKANPDWFKDRGVASQNSSSFLQTADICAVRAVERNNAYVDVTVKEILFGNTRVFLDPKKLPPWEMAFVNGALTAVFKQIPKMSALGWVLNENTLDGGR